ncbi:hypothetical protein ACIHCQ_35125 [Streptomyces sp. NPDC052236]|uniref:hypothetical protein n=1 Tax=Streptomyces sp. NPDC052236 TaxID=3365686 RepID=UPI0037D01A7A
MSSATSGYRPLLRIPGAPAFFLTAAVGRVGIAMTGLGLVWLLHARTGSYGTAGLATAGFALAEALIGPHLARLVDRFGQTCVLPFCLLAHGTAIAGVLASTTPAAAIASTTCAGAAIPQLGALSAARWAHLLRGQRADELPTAFSWPAPSLRPCSWAEEGPWLPSAVPRPRPPAGTPSAPAANRACCDRTSFSLPCSTWPSGCTSAPWASR